MNEILLSSKKTDYETPQWLFDKLDKEFDFTLDACADGSNNKCCLYFTDCLNKDWYEFITLYNLNYDIFMNPPYGRKIGLFIKKAYEESLKGCTVVCLIPARTDTRWWWDYCLHAAEIRFLKGRLKFGGGNHSSTFPSAIVIFKPKILLTYPNIRWVDYRKENER